MRVNEHFASELDKLLRPDDLVWVHDYHLIPLAKMLRARGHNNRIGYFLHIPCPPPEVLTALPGHERLIPTLGEYDLVGFQTGDDAFNFSRYLTRECGLHSRDFSFAIGDREVRVDAFPVGIETEHFAKTARRAVKSSFVQNVVGSLNGARMIIGVDRLDYSKGLNLRLDAFEQFLRELSRTGAARSPICRSRRKAAARFPNMCRWSSMVSQGAGRINGAYGEADWTPIRYVNRAYSRTALAGLYRSARVGLVTPLRDGMNLVAKEYVAAQDRGRSGRAGAVALRRRRARMQGCAAGQPLRHRGRGRRDQPRAVDAAARNAARATPRCMRRSCATTSRTGPSASSRR